MNDIYIKINSMNIKEIIREEISKFNSEEDRHREGYWKERWAKQKAAKEAEKQANEPKSEPSKPKKSRCKRMYYGNIFIPQKGDDYYDFYEQEKNKSNYDIGTEVWPDVFVIGYDELGRPVTNNPRYDMLNNAASLYDEGWDD